jgi:hypothetical protein
MLIYTDYDNRQHTMTTSDIWLSVVLINVTAPVKVCEQQGEVKSFCCGCVCDEGGRGREREWARERETENCQNGPGTYIGQKIGLKTPP